MRETGTAASTLVRQWLAAALALAPLGLPLAPASAAGCEDISAYQTAVVSGAPSGTDAVVPVVIHLMERPGQACEVRKSWTAKQVATVFGPDVSDDGSVSSVWGSKVKVEIRGVLLHEYRAPADLIDSQQRIKVPTTGPTGSAAYEAAFDKVVAEFHRESSVNVYLWRRLAGEPIGFGRSTRSGKGKASIFLDVRCGQTSLRTCATLASHELGHTMGLYHAGPNTCGSVDPNFQPLCAAVAAPCSEVTTAQRLMTIGASGRGLCPKTEVPEAVSMANQHFR